MSEQIAFTVYCKPQPQGSMKVFRNGGITSANPNLYSFRQQVGVCAMLEVAKQSANKPVFGEGVALAMDVTFYFLRPKSAKKRKYPSVKPDVDKLWRAVMDSLKGIVYADDAQVIGGAPWKFYGDVERTEIVIRTME